MATKKIEFNPLLLSGGPSKTKKNRTPKAAPLINPNILKNKLLKRIKEHKNKEQNELKQSASNEAKTRKQTSSQKAGSSKSYTDEFNDSIEYLEALSKKTKEREKSGNNRSSSTNNMNTTYASSPYVNLDLPEELMETPKFISTPPIIPTPAAVIQTVASSGDQLATILPSTPLEIIQPTITPTVPPSSMMIQTQPLVQDPPWGVLKNGSKPTYRQFNTHNSTMKIHHPHSHSNQNLDLHSLSSSPTERENKLEELKAKLQTNPTPSSSFSSSSFNNDDSMNQNEIHTIQRTIKRKYSVGKHKNKRSVGVLLKNRESRKNAIKTQKLWKQEPLSEMKKYLRKHNLLKVGSFAPTEVVKKLYESAMLAGDITNSNKDTMIHNFVKDNEESPF